MDYSTRPVKEFRREYVTDDTGTMVTSGPDWIMWLEDEMKACGYARVLDTDLKHYIDFDEKTELFTVTFVLQGVFVGKRKAWTIYGIKDGKTIGTSPLK